MCCVSIGEESLSLCVSMTASCSPRAGANTDCGPISILMLRDKANIPVTTEVNVRTRTRLRFAL
jgi:hypothetical protein